MHRRVRCARRFGRPGALWPGARRQADRCWRVNAEHAAERTEDAAGLRGCGEQGGTFGAVDQGFDWAAELGGALDEADEPGMAARQAERGLIPA